MMNLPMHIRKQSHQTDLLTFSSWDFSSQAPSIHDEEFSLDSNSLLTHTSIDEQEIATPQSANKKLTVSVSGSVFSLDPILFRKLERLPWRHVDPAHGGGYSLDTSPDLFEKLINFIENGSLPVLKKISTSDKEELEYLAAVLELHGLQDHLNRKGRPRAPSSFRLNRERSDKSHASNSSSSLTSTTTSGSAPTTTLGKVKRKTALLLRGRSTESSSSGPRRMTHKEMSALSDRFQ